MEEEGDFRQVRMADDVYQEFKRRLEEVKAAPAAAAPRASGRCGMDVIFGPDGEIKSMSCGGSCGFIDRFLGRSCKIVSESTPGGGARFYCTCSGGWFDRLLGRT